MTIRVFISATCEDLESDCRPSVKRAVANKAVPVEMNSWVTDFVDPVSVCRKKIKSESSHYLGVFAYRRGWVPEVLGGKSITEAEFDWACEYEKTMAVLLPVPTSDFASELRLRAAGQSQPDADAQEAFLARVRNLGTCMTFEDRAHLEGMVSDKVAIWTMGGSIRAIAVEREAAPAEHKEPGRQRVTANEFIKLGRKQHVREFEDCLDTFTTRDAPVAACFLIHGRGGFGHRQLSARLIKTLEDRGGDYKKCKVDIRPDWRGKDISSLIEVVGRDLELDLGSNSVESLAAKLRKLLETGDVVLEFADLQRLEGSLPAFVEEFWRPITQTLGEPGLHRLIGLVSFEQQLKPELAPILHRPQAGEAADAFKMIALPELSPFSKEELTLWLGARGLAPERARTWAETLIGETEGVPSALYRKIEEGLN